MTRLLGFVCLIGLLFSAAASAQTVHTVVAGDTLYSLARQYGVTVEEITARNGISDPRSLRIGMRLEIPGPATGHETYTVKQGEYPYGIAEKLGIDYRELMLLNNLDERDIVRPGDELILPDRYEEATPTTASTSTKTSTAATDSSSTAPNGGGSAIAVEASSRTATGEFWPHPGERSIWEQRFPGVTMAGTEGDPIRSVTSGIVTWSGPYSTFGRVVIVTAPTGYRFLYAGLDQTEVSVGQEVAPGTEIGTMGYARVFDSPRVLLSVVKDLRYIVPELAPRG